MLRKNLTQGMFPTTPDTTRGRGALQKKPQRHDRHPAHGARSELHAALRRVTNRRQQQQQLTTENNAIASGVIHMECMHWLGRCQAAQSDSLGLLGSGRWCSIVFFSLGLSLRVIHCRGIVLRAGCIYRLGRILLHMHFCVLSKMQDTHSISSVQRMLLLIGCGLCFGDNG